MLASVESYAGILTLAALFSADAALTILAESLLAKLALAHLAAASCPAQCFYSELLILMSKYAR